MHYVKLNIVDFIKKQKFLFAILIFSQILSVILVFSSYGIINHFDVKVQEAEGTSLRLDFSRTGEQCATVESCRNFLKVILPVIECKLDYFFIFGFDNGIAIESETDYKKGKYIVDEGYKEYVDTLISEGRYFNDDEIGNCETR